jgi:hypothetical protein
VRLQEAAPWGPARCRAVATLAGCSRGQSWESAPPHLISNSASSGNNKYRDLITIFVRITADMDLVHRYIGGGGVGGYLTGTIVGVSSSSSNHQQCKLRK